MRPSLYAAILLVGLSVALANADGKPTQPPKLSRLTPANDSRLAKAKGVQPQKIGVLTYYPNNGGGYTFIQEKYIIFYALPYAPTSCEGEETSLMAIIRRDISTIGACKMPFGGHTVYRSVMLPSRQGNSYREDIPIAKWTRDTPDGNFRLSITSDDHETRLKLKSIVPVLELMQSTPTKPILAAVVLVVVCRLALPSADDKPSLVSPEKDGRLAQLKGSQSKKIGVLTYYPNRSGGYTFLEGTEIVFYALPYWPSTSVDFFFVE